MKVGEKIIMKDFRTNTPEKMLLALLKASLNVEEPCLSCFEGVSADDWKECSQLAAKQGVLALAWDGVLRLPEHLQPYRNLKISWALAVEAYEEKYVRYCRAVSDLSELYAGQGIKTVQLKGVGLSTYYPIPCHREGGDIDIYTFYADGSCADVEADRLIEQRGGEVDRDSSTKHSLFYFNGIPVENHRTLLDVDKFPLAMKVEGMLKKVMNSKETMLPDGSRILTPSIEFNTLFVAFHSFLHYGGGLALHHLCDWACIIKKNGVVLPNGLKDRYFIRGVDALTLLCNRYLGTDVATQGGEKLAGEIMNEIFHPINDREPAFSGALGNLLFKMKRFVDMTRLKNSILHTPLLCNRLFWEKIRKSMVWHLSAPKRIFSNEK